MSETVYVNAKNEPQAILLAQRKLASNENARNRNHTNWLQYAYNGKTVWAVTFTQGGYIAAQIEPR